MAPPPVLPPYAAAPAGAPAASPPPAAPAGAPFAAPFPAPASPPMCPPKPPCRPSSAQTLRPPKGDLSQACRGYLRDKNIPDINGLRDHLACYTEGCNRWEFPCKYDEAAARRWGPNPIPDHKIGGTDTTDMRVLWGNIGIVDQPACCGWRPHFNWVVATCEETRGTGQFCSGLDATCSDNVQINYVTAYQFDERTQEWHMMLDSTCAENPDEKGFISGQFDKKTGFEKHKSDFRWQGGDWTTKYAPWARQTNEKVGVDGPRGGTPPACMFVLSAENFYYGAFYMLLQQTLNTSMYPEAGSNCWVWELDPFEGSGGWAPAHKDADTKKLVPGVYAQKINDLFNTDNAQVSGNMPVSYTRNQVNNQNAQEYYPNYFRDYCDKNPGDEGCSTKEGNVWWSGTASGSKYFSQKWKEPVVIVVVIDAKGFWTYRFTPDKVTGLTKWKGIERYRAATTLKHTSPDCITDPKGLQTPVGEDVADAVQLSPALPSDAACVRASIEAMNWDFTSNAWGSMMWELYGKDRKSEDGPFNFWNYMVDTNQQCTNYTPAIMGGTPPETPSECHEIPVGSCPCQA